MLEAAHAGGRYRRDERRLEVFVPLVIVLACGVRPSEYMIVFFFFFFVCVFEDIQS